MRRELRAAIREGINNSNLNGYKWTITPNGLDWSYGETFIFDLSVGDSGEKFLSVKAEQAGITMAALFIGNDFYHDCRSVEEGYRIATEATIRRANNLY